MTCIVGIERTGASFIGGDSAVSDTWTVRQSSVRKVFRKGDYTIGYTTSFRMGQILEHMIPFPECKEPTEDFMVRDFVESVRKGFKEFGYAKIESNEETGGQFIVGVQGTIFEIDSDYQVCRHADGLYAVGSGFSFALGALKALDLLDPMQRIATALEISSYFNAYVKPPFVILKV
ncbi:MAG TPA: hypothetical protein VIH42_08195 [Thermoguttaceae bacterium]